MKKVLKTLLKLVTLTVVLIAIVGIIFISTSPQFGSRDKAFSMERMLQSENYNGEIFTNLEVTPKGDIALSTMLEFFATDHRRFPDWLIPVKERLTEEFNAPEQTTRLTWFGHSAVLLEIDGKTIFFDPMLGDVPAPLPFLGTPRYNPTLPLNIDNVPELDAVIISHDHYDHLDYESISLLKDRVEYFYTALGVGSHLVAWGVDPHKVIELDWWEETKLGDVLIAATPSRHFSGRGLSDSDETQWASWVIKGEQASVFFSGDSGYAKSFKTIGEKYGPFDIAMVECGQYHTDWKSIHMMPEESVQANQDLNSKLLMPIHWGSFSISLHDWDEPVKRALAAAKPLNVPVTTPIIGETIIIGEKAPSSRWWERK